MFRVGDDVVARLPLRPSSVPPLDTEHRWLPVFAPHLPMAIPVPLAKGEPTDEFPWPWSVLAWFDGEDATTADLDLNQAARDIAHLIRSLQALDPTAGPESMVAYCGRGVPLRMRDQMTRQSLAASGGLIDVAAVTAEWERALHAPTWDRPPVWVHGDIAAGNLIVQDGRLRAVIDWGTLAVGDPACDLIVAWELFDAEAREVLRTELAVDDATWARGRGWALSTAILALPYYVHTNPFMADQARHKLDQLLAE